MPSNLFEWDELHIIREDARRMIREAVANKRKPSKGSITEFCDYLEFVLCLVYAYGWQDAEEIVGLLPFRDGLDDKAVNQKIDGETFRERIVKQINELSEEGVLRIIDTEAHRDYNTAVYDAGKRSGIPLRKTWHTMLDWKVRDSHQFLEGVTVGLDDLFYTDDGDSAMYPGGFGTPENNCNCRCWVTIGR